MKSVEDGACRIVVTEYKPDGPSPKWEAERDDVATVLVRVLLQFRERLISEGKLKP